MDVIFEQILAPKSGTAIELDAGQRLRVIDLEGQQVVDMALFNKTTQKRNCLHPIRERVMFPSLGLTMFRVTP